LPDDAFRGFSAPYALTPQTEPLAVARRAKRYIDASAGTRTGASLVTAATALAIINICLTVGVAILIVVFVNSDIQFIPSSQFISSFIRS